MKRALGSTAILATTWIGQPAVASEGGSCHFHGSKPAVQAAVLGCARQRKEALVKAGSFIAADVTGK
jgi:hypothetical protein